MAPTISEMVTFCLNISTDGGIIRIGTIDMIVDVTPVLASCMANNDRETPMKGPKKEPMIIPFIPSRFWSASKPFLILPMNIMMSVKPTILAIIRICVEANGL